MFQANQSIERVALWAGSLLVLLLLGFSAFSGNYYALVLPFLILFAGLLITNWKAAWWIFLFSVPLSQQIYLLNKTLSTSLPDEPIMWCFLLLFLLHFAAN